MIDYTKIIYHFYPEADKLRDILLVHSRGVANLALEIFDANPQLFANSDRNFVEAAAMLHDIGIRQCNAPGIGCYGTEYYICHGTLGARMMRELDISAAEYGLSVDQQEMLARVCERHTGTGLTRQQIEKQGLPLPHCDLTPETIEEQLVCYADKFYSKTHPEVRKTYERAERSLMKFGEEGIVTFRRWHEMFRLP